MKTRPKEPGSQGKHRGSRHSSIEFIPREGKRCKLRRKSTTTIGSKLGGKIWTIESTSRQQEESVQGG
jgi:hypothetical protein